MKCLVCLLGACTATVVVLQLPEYRPGDTTNTSIGFIERVVPSLLHLVGRYSPGIDTPFGRVEFQTERVGGGLSIVAKCTRCSISHSLIGTKPFVTNAAEVKGTLKGTQFDGTLRIGSLVLEMDGTWKQGALAAKFRLPTTSIADAYFAFQSVVPEAKTAKIGGHFSGVGSFAWPNFEVFLKPTIKKFSVQGLVDRSVYSRGTFSYQVLDRERKTRTRVSGEGSQDWYSLAQIGTMVPAIVIAAEDGAFYSHPAYDLSGILEAAESNKKRKKIRRGGSTISQQLAKNLFLNHERSYSRKLRELLYAVDLEQTLGKRRVLELYLNIVEWGPNIFGIGQAAMVYFGKTPKALTIEEVVWLASILPNPGDAYVKQYLRGRPAKYAMERIFGRLSGFSPEELTRAREARLVFRSSKSAK